MYSVWQDRPPADCVKIGFVLFTPLHVATCDRSFLKLISSSFSRSHLNSQTVKRSVQ